MRLPNFKNSLPTAPIERFTLNVERWTFLLLFALSFLASLHAAAPAPPAPVFRVISTFPIKDICLGA